MDKNYNEQVKVNRPQSNGFHLRETLFWRGINVNKIHLNKKIPIRVSYGRVKTGTTNNVQNNP